MESKESNPWVNLSYYEFKSNPGHYLGLYPSNRTMPPKQLLVPGGKLFDFDPEQGIQQLVTYCDYLNDNNFGFFDFVGYLHSTARTTSEYNTTQLVNHLISLVVTQVYTERYHQVVRVESLINPEFSLKLYARERERVLLLRRRVMSRSSTSTIRISNRSLILIT